MVSADRGTIIQLTRQTFFAEADMPQSVLFKGYTVSGAAREHEGQCHASYVIEKDKRLIQKAGFVLTLCALSMAENAAVLRALQRINEWDED